MGPFQNVKCEYVIDLISNILITNTFLRWNILINIAYLPTYVLNRENLWLSEMCWNNRAPKCVPNHNSKQSGLPHVKSWKLLNLRKQRTCK